MQNTATQNSIRLYEGSFQFDSISTNLNISPDFAQMKLAKQYEYRATTESLWAEITVAGVTNRYELDYKNVKLNKIS